MLRKRISVFLVLVLVVTLIFGTFAGAATSQSFELVDELGQLDFENLSKDVIDRIMEFSTIAYMDLDSASPRMQSTIIEARNVIISTQTWRNGVEAYIIDFSDGTFHAIAEFHDLFPSDWEIPTLEAIGISREVLMTEDTGFVNEALVMGRQNLISPMNNNFNSMWSGTVNLRNPSSTVTSSNFATIHSTGWATYVTRAISLPGNSWNVGYSNSRGVSVASATNLTITQGLSLTGTTNGSSWGVRASTFSTTGNSTLDVGFLN